MCIRDSHIFDYFKNMFFRFDLEQQNATDVKNKMATFSFFSFLLIDAVVLIKKVKQITK